MSVTVTSDHVNPIPVGVIVNLTCTVVLNSELAGVLSSLRVTVRWSTPRGSIRISYHAPMTMTSPPTYTTTLRVHLGAYSSYGSYACRIQVNAPSSFLLDSTSVIGMTMITVGNNTS